MTAHGDKWVPNADELLRNNATYAAAWADGHLPVEPQRKLAVVACMDSRMDIFEMLGLRHGEAHIIRNAGGVITDDVTRSLCVSQRFLGTREIEDEVGVKPAWALETFNDPFLDTQQSIRRIQMSPFVRHKDNVRGFVYDVDTGQLHEVQP